MARVDLGFSSWGRRTLPCCPAERSCTWRRGWYAKALDTRTNTLLSTLNSVSGDVFGLAVTPDGSRLYATEFFSPAVLVFDTADNLFVTSIPLTSRPRDIAITPDGTLALVPGEQNLSPTGYDVRVIDVASDIVTGAIPVGCGPAAVAVGPSPSGHRRQTALTDGDTTAGSDH